MNFQADAMVAEAIDDQAADGTAASLNAQTDCIHSCIAAIEFDERLSLVPGLACAVDDDGIGNCGQCRKRLNRQAGTFFEIKGNGVQTGIGVDIEDSLAQGTSAGVERIGHRESGKKPAIFQKLKAKP